MLHRRNQSPALGLGPQGQPHSGGPKPAFRLPEDGLHGVHSSPKQNILAQEVSDELILLDVVGGGYFGLDKVGARIWRLLAEGRSAADILETLLAEYAVDEPRARQDLLALLGELNMRGLIELHGLAPS